jgi:hypothetical protein
MAFAGGLDTFRQRCAEIADNGYEGFQLTKREERVNA